MLTSKRSTRNRELVSKVVDSVHGLNLFDEECAEAKVNFDPPKNVIHIAGQSETASWIRDVAADGAAGEDVATWPRQKQMCAPTAI